MKKNLLWSMFAAAAVVLLAGCGSKEVKTVKNGVLGIDKSRTVEQMLSAKLADLQWKSFSSTDNRRVVEVSGIWKDNKYREMAKDVKKGSLQWALYSEIHLAPFDGDKVTLQFVMHVDGRQFNFAYAEIRDANNKIKEVEAPDKKHIKKATTGSEGFFSRDKFLTLFFTE